MTSQSSLRTADPRPARWRLALAGLTAVLAVLLLASQALALSQRGHTFKGAFGSEGEGSLSKPGAIAVSDSTGDVYVLDRRHDRVVQYTAEGRFVSAWGWSVNPGTPEKCTKNGECKYEVCTSTCKETGVAGRGDYEFNSFTLAIAVDNCTSSEGKPCSVSEDPSVGDVYVLKEYADKEQADKELKPEEKEKEKEVKEKEKEGILFTEDEREALEHEFSEYLAISKFSPDGAPIEEFADNEEACYFEKQYKKTGNEANGGELACEDALETTEVHGLTVGTDGTPLLYYEEELRPFSDAHLSGAPSSEPLGGFTVGEAAEGVNAGLSEDARGHFYIGQQLLGPAENPLDLMSEWETIPNESGEAQLEEVTLALDDEDTTAVAANPLDVSTNDVDEQNDVYITNLAGAPGKHSTSVAQFAPSGSLLERFSTAGLAEGAGVAVNPASGAVYVTDAATGDVDLFTLEEPSAPTVDSLSAQEVSSTSAQLNAQIDPDGAATTYAFRYSTGAVPAASEPCASPCVETPTPEQALGNDYTDHDVGATLELGPATTYHYRVIARNTHGAAEGPEHSFSTPPASGEHLADQRVWEMVSPADTGGANVDVINEEPNGLIQAAANGGAITYATSGPVGETEGNRSYEVTQLLSERDAHGWESQDIVTPNEHALSLPVGKGAGLPPEYQFFSEDLSLAIVYPYVPEDLGKGSENSNLADPPLSPPVTEAEKGKQERTIYVRDNKPIAPTVEPEAKVYKEAAENGERMENPGYIALLTEANLPGVQFGTAIGAPAFDDASPDLSTAVVSIPAGAKGAKEGLYANSEGALKAVSLPPGENVEPVPGSLGTGSRGGVNKRHAISTDGSRIFWEGTSGSYEHHLYMRAAKTPSGDSVPEETIQLDKAQGVTEPSDGGAEFQTASADGSRVFFTDTQPLTAKSGDVGTRDLYVCEILENAEHKLECKLIDLTPKHETPTHDMENADVQGVVLGASEEGAYVYFVAGAVLSEAANSEGDSATPGLCGREGFPEATCNLYVGHYNSERARWETTFIAALSQQDAPDWESVGASERNELERITSRVSPNGLYLAFMSERELTGYDNVDTHPEAHGAHDQEVFEYAATSGAEEVPTPAQLICASCDPSGARPSGVFDHDFRQEEEEGKTNPSRSLAVDPPGIWSNRWLAGSIPGWTSLAANSGAPPFAIYQSRFLSNSGRLYFDSPADLVAAATNGIEDVYEYEPPGVPQGRHRCTSASSSYSERDGGCIGLISSGVATEEAAFLDASETGGEGPHGEQLQEGGADVFFVSSAELVPQDTEATFSLFDAHECTTASACIVPPEEKPPTQCESTDTCRTYTPPTGSSLGAPASAGPGASGNVVPGHGVLPTKVATKPKPTPLTRAQKLAKALKTCRASHKHSRKKRLACEKQARKRYGHAAKKAKKARKATRKNKR